MSYAPAPYWDTYFRAHRQAGTDLDWGEQWTSFVAPQLRAHQCCSVLDLGCGTGNDTMRLAQQGFILVGLDYSAEALRQATDKAAGAAQFVQGDMGVGIPFRNATFDALMANVAMHMFNDQITQRLFREVYRVLRPGGLFVFHVNALEDRPIRAQRKPPVRELEPNYVLEADGQTMHFFSDKYLYELLEPWTSVQLALIEITTATTTTQFQKYVWRGIARC